LNHIAQAWNWVCLPRACLTMAPLPAFTPAGGLLKRHTRHARDAEVSAHELEARGGRPQTTPGQVLLLCWTHAVIGFGFFGATHGDGQGMSCYKRLACTVQRECMVASHSACIGSEQRCKLL